ncbi:helix-turn-helix domain-containing protein [Croceicoccus bisphenolivorans]|uniref:helix-turn-helix domain-containing protein n=1 Tax=Croceicoccus bisphenolivorans TaxID=1783232 RepID=UPI000A8ACA3A|nr:helix-turn-helix domain-containing protein [Croceicoccus bisphenolivorans]
MENLWYYPDMKPDVASIPRFALYGEDLGEHFEELVHCETIASRSRRYDWEIAPHRHPALCQMLLLGSGSVDLLLAGHGSQRIGPVLIVAPEGVIHGFHFSRDAQGYVVTLSEKFVREFADDNVLAELLSHADVLSFDVETASRLSAVAQQILFAATGGARPELLRRALAEAFIRIAAEVSGDDVGTHCDTLVQQFQKLVQQHLRRQRKLGFYAQALNCTERTLSRRVHGALGVSPGQYLNDRIAAEATRLLRFTNASCNDVADELGFVDPSYFSRFYTRMTGRRPSAVRGSEG